MYILTKAWGEGVGKISFFFMNSRRDKEFMGKIAYFRVSGKILPLGGVGT